MFMARVFVICNVKYSVLTYLLFFAFFSSAQGFLNDTVSVSLTGTYFNSIYEVDSGYYCVGMVPHPTEPGNPDQFLLGFMSFEGDWETKLLDYDTLQDQRSGFSHNSLILNNQGNFVHVYSNCGDGNCYPRLKEVTPEGQIVRDTIYRDVIDSLGLIVFDGNNLYFDSFSGDYTVLSNTSDTARFEAGFPDFGTQLYLRIDQNFTIVDTIHFTDPNQTHSYIYASKCIKFNGIEVVMIQDQKQAGSAENREGKMVFYEVDQNGLHQRMADYNVGQYERQSRSLISTFDSAFVFFYIQSEWVIDEWRYTNMLCKLDSNYQLIWETPLFYTSYPSPGSTIFAHRVVETIDSAYVVAMGGANVDFGVVLMKIHKYGAVEWERHIVKPIPNIQDTSYSDVEIRDVIKNSKGGYTMIGRHDNEILGPIVTINGYVVETNCLGFMGPPEGHADYLIEDNFQVSFYNQSMQAGSYTWDFGDGTLLETDEYSDTISHTYTGFGNYEVILIARGCAGENDTVQFNVIAALHTNPSLVTDGQGYFTLFPNPIAAGNLFNVYINGLDPNDGTVWLELINAEGRRVQEIQLSAKEGTYMLNLSLASGIYMVNLNQGGSVLQSRKLMVY
jgi:hypothetical protein